MDELSEDDKLTVARARKAQRFMSQPFHVAEVKSSVTVAKGVSCTLPLLHISSYENSCDRRLSSVK